MNDSPTTSKYLHNLPKEVFNELNLDLGDYLHNFFNRSGRKSIDYDIPGWSISVYSALSARLIEKGLIQHSEALVESAKASEKHARSLTFAT